jgi:hypothetical protein
MEFTHENVKKWLEDYFQEFNRSNGDPATVPNMEKYFTPDLVFTSYILGVKRPDDRAGLLGTMVHPGLIEELEPEEIIIDEERQSVAVILRVQFTDKHDGTVFPVAHNCAIYDLVPDAENNLQIKKITYYTEPRPPEDPDIKALMKKYREEA